MALSATNIAWLEERGLDPETAQQHGVSDSEQTGFDIQFPYIRRDELVNHKYRTTRGEKRFSQDKGGVKCFWNIDVMLERPTRVIITEGEPDALASLQVGEIYTLSVPDGAPSVEIPNDDMSSKYSYVIDALPLFSDTKEIILAVDDDPAGHRLLNDLALRFNKARCKWIKYPEGCKDLADVARAYGNAKIVEVLRSAEWMDLSGVFKLSQLPPLPVPVPMDTGIPGLQPHFNIREGDLSVITGVPGHGKSTVVNQIVAGMIEFHGWKCALGAFEQRPSIDGRRSFRTLHGHKLERDMTNTEKLNADRWIENNIEWIYPPDIDVELTLEWLMDRFAGCAIRHDCKLLVLDPWNELDHIRPRDMTMTEYVGFAIRELKRFALRHSVHVMVVAHPAKLQRNKDGKMVKPSLYDIADSANWYNKPDVGIVVHTVSGLTEIEVVKSRVRTEIGEPGSIELVFNQTAGRYERDPHTAAFDL